MFTTFPPQYTQLLAKLGDIDTHEAHSGVSHSGVYLYGRIALPERNETYAIAEDEPDYVMIGQDGDIAFFVHRSCADETIYANDLGALGSLKMQAIAPDIDAFIRQLEQGIRAY